jgi:hypothetical protein
MFLIRFRISINLSFVPSVSLNRLVNRWETVIQYHPLQQSQWFGALTVVKNSQEQNI